MTDAIFRLRRTAAVIREQLAELDTRAEMPDSPQYKKWLAEHAGRSDFDERLAEFSAMFDRAFTEGFLQSCVKRLLRVCKNAFGPLVHEDADRFLKFMLRRERVEMTLEFCESAFAWDDVIYGLPEALPNYYVYPRRLAA